MKEDLEVALTTFRDSLTQTDRFSYDRLEGLKDDGYIECKWTYSTNGYTKDAIKPSPAGELILGLSTERDELLEQIAELKERLGDTQ